LASALATRTSAAGPEIPRDKTPTALPSPATSDPNPQPSQIEQQIEQIEPAVSSKIEMIYISLSNGKELHVSTTSQRSAGIIESIFKGKTFLSEEEMMRAITTPGTDAKLGFNRPEIGNALFNMPLAMRLFAGAYVVGNERKRLQENSGAGYQFYQPPDQAKITAAKTYVRANELAAETLKIIGDFEQNFEATFSTLENVHQRDTEFQQIFSTGKTKREQDFQKRFKSTRTLGQRILDFFRERFNLFGATAYREEKEKARESFSRSCWHSEKESYEHSCRQQAKEKFAGECRKRLVQITVEFCANSDLYITALEPCSDTNNGFKNFSRVFHSLTAGVTAPLRVLLKNEDNQITAESLRVFSQEYGQELLDTAVQSLYKATHVDRESLAKAYQEYYSSISKQCPDLDGMILNVSLELHQLYLDVQSLIKQRTSEGKRPVEAEEEVYNNSEFQRRWENLRPNFVKHEEDGGITLDLGHIKVMVNANQEKYLTFENVFSKL
ncbi:MAG: hypothetical protein LBF42_02285, partial [Puniceicoccales bacterium]|nr:hypothetical protein [Puniceicoccales bacterium]